LERGGKEKKGRESFSPAARGDRTAGTRPPNPHEKESLEFSLPSGMGKRGGGEGQTRKPPPSTPAGKKKERKRKPRDYVTGLLWLSKGQEKGEESSCFSPLRAPFGRKKKKLNFFLNAMLRVRRGEGRGPTSATGASSLVQRKGKRR